ncbi:MAG: ArdC family protein [Firmicutes bacterium]|nr:ArdC family protein [Bacillota bacterium]
MPGYRTWQKCGRHVKKGEKGIAIFAPLTYKQEVTDEDTGEAVTRTRLGSFRAVHVGEVIAEGAAYIAACHFGIDPGESSFEYVAAWTKDPEKVLAWGDSVRKVANEIISLLGKIQERGVAA